MPIFIQVARNYILAVGVELVFTQLDHGLLHAESMTKRRNICRPLLLISAAMIFLTAEIALVAPAIGQEQIAPPTAAGANHGFSVFESAQQPGATQQPGVAAPTAQPRPLASSNSAPMSADLPTEESEKLNQFLTSIVLDSIPHQFEDDKKWGKQDERWDGLHIRREGWEIKTKRRKKMVNHGTWKKYSAELIDPEEQFSIQVMNTRATEDDEVAFDVEITAKLNLHGRQSKWVKGVQLYSLSVDGHADVRLTTSVELGTSMDISKFPPDLLFDPKIVDAQLELIDFRINRVSKAGGEFAQQLSRGVRSTLERKVDEKEEKLITKMNAAIEKNREKLRLSIHDAVKSKWFGEAKELLPADVKEAFEDKE